MEPDFAALIAAARALAGEFRTDGCVSAGSVGAAILSASGAVYTGVCIDALCGIGFCAEHAALASMLAAREWHIVAAVAVGDDGVPMPPCGRCREFMYQLSRRNLDAVVQISLTERVTLGELLPRPWNYA